MSEPVILFRTSDFDSRDELAIARKFIMSGLSEIGTADLYQNIARVLKGRSPC